MIHKHSPKVSLLLLDDEDEEEEEDLLLLLLRGFLLLLGMLDLESPLLEMRFPLTKFNADKQLLRMPSFKLLLPRLLLCCGDVGSFAAFTRTVTGTQLHLLSLLVCFFLLFFAGFCCCCCS